MSVVQNFRTMHVLETSTEEYAVEEVCEPPRLPAWLLTMSCRLVERLQEKVDTYEAVFARLFPGKDLQELVSLPRIGLINLATASSVASTSAGHSLDRPLPGRENVNKSEDSASLDALEEAPDQDPELDESKRLQDKIQGISDDINGLSLVNKTSSYVGVSSIAAAIKVVFKVAPMARSLIVKVEAETAEATVARPYDLDPDPDELPTASLGKQLIDSYFAHIHALMPMIDEDGFRYSYEYGSRRDPSWLCLLNMVFALGSLASSTCSNAEHFVYFGRARKRMRIETFGSGSLFTLQAFALLSGCYLHWLNRPNEANSIMGATLRMATAHGLHKEYDNRKTADAADRNDTEATVETRRRTWWTLYILDSWANMTTGRPSLGRTGPGITTKSPRTPEQFGDAQDDASLRLLPIIHNISFCKVATKVQDALAAHTTISSEELHSLDAELERWHDELPPILRDVLEPPTRLSSSVTDFSESPGRDKIVCPEVLLTPRAIMHWRYQNLKILMYRPILLATALRRTSWSSMSTEERVAVATCRNTASQSIADIDDSCQDSLIAGWNAVWMMYQAVIIPLVSLFAVLTIPSTIATTDSPSRTPDTFGSETIHGSDSDIEIWKQDVEKSITFFDRMQPWSVAASKSRDVVQRLYDATKLVIQISAASSAQANTSALEADMSLSQSSMAQYDVTKIAWNTSAGVNGDAAMNDFGDDMIWDLPNTSSLQNEWWAPQDWPLWEGGPQMR